jgi:hypothetical protein
MTLRNNDQKKDDNNDPYTFPLICPRDEELMEFLNYSLWYEEMIVPKFYHQPGVKEKHISDFWVQGPY